MTKTWIPGLFAVSLLTVASVTTVAAQRPDRYTRDYARMTGTYELDRSSGDDPQRAADAATRSLPPGRRERAYQNLLSRLAPPQMLAIDRRGQLITISSSSGPRATVDADGQVRNEPGPNGRMIATRAEMRGDQLSVSTSGNRGSDYVVTFEAISNGDRLLVERRLDDEELAGPVMVRSYYHRIADEPRWDLSSAPPPSREPVYDNRRPEVPYPAPAPFAVAEGTRLIATLDTPLDTRTSRGGDRFTMTVRSPRQFEGARIDGVISRVNPEQQSNNLADMIVMFETIRFRDGQSSEFRAVLDTVRTPDGDTLRVDAEGGMRDGGTTDTRVEHGAIGAALGAIIGAVAGGGKGAVIGGVIGGAGGAILVEGRDHLDLPRGTEVSLIATAPRYR